MALRKIYTFSEKVLRQEAETVDRFDDDLKLLITDMVDTMREAPGVGLAAPQIGVSKRVIVVEFGHEEDESIPKQLYAVVNPEIVRLSEETVSGIEGCLSVPGFIGEVDRARIVTVKGQDSEGKPITIRAEGWLARIFQHEIDHVNGILYTDRAENIWKPEPEEMDSI
ncbi:MAG: peptide deformylase [Brevefilum sp.]|jgi:peptide deformylase